MGNRESINNYIYHLDYDPKQVITFNGNHVENYDKKTGKVEKGKYTVITREKCSIDGNIDLCVPAGNMSVTYPGGLVCVNSDLVDGKPQAIGAKRSSVVLTMNLPGMTSDNSETVETANNANVTAAINRILNNWYTNYRENCAIPSQMSYIGGIVYDKKEMQLKFGCDVKYLEEKLGINFNAIKKDEKSVYLAKYKQIFYTASVEPYAEPADAFADDVTEDLLKHNGVNDENPPGYIGCVIYGREIYVSFESTYSQAELEAAINASVTVKGVNISPDAKARYEDVYKNTSCKVIALGGKPLDYSGVMTNSNALDIINKAIFENIVLGPDNPAYPLSYKTVFLKDNKVAAVSGTTEYVEETIEEFSNGVLKLEHTGAYVAKFYIDWKEITGYDNNGNAIMKDCAWGENGNHKTAKYSAEIALGGNVRDINIKAQGATGLVWDKWHTPLDRKNLSMVPERKVNIWGTTLNQKGSCEPS